MNVLIIGASNKKERYAYMAMERLEKAGHRVFLFNPKLDEIEGRPVIQSLSKIDQPIDTITLYLGPQNLEAYVDEILALEPRRIISNPGTENTFLPEKAAAAGIQYFEACTLVMLSTKQF